jgi:hypothetical protein
MGALGDKLHAAHTVGLDSAIFIYYFEEHPRYQALCAEAFDLMEAGAIQKVTEIEVIVLERWLQQQTPPPTDGET